MVDYLFIMAYVSNLEEAQITLLFFIVAAVIDLGGYFRVYSYNCIGYYFFLKKQSRSNGHYIFFLPKSAGKFLPILCVIF